MKFQTWTGTIVEASLALSQYQMIKVEANGDRIYQGGNTYVRLSPLPGGRAKMVITNGTCAC